MSFSPAANSIITIYLFCLIRLSSSFTPTQKLIPIASTHTRRSKEFVVAGSMSSSSNNSADASTLFQPTVVLTTIAAEEALAAAEREASANEWKVTIAISDAGGNPLLVKRCDGAFAASYEIAVGKAKTAAQFCKNTGSLEAAANVRDGTSRAALLSAPFVLMRGGVPIFVNEICVGAVGVSGVLPDQDEQVAMAAVNALTL